MNYPLLISHGAPAPGGPRARAGLPGQEQAAACGAAGTRPAG